MWSHSCGWSWSLSFFRKTVAPETGWEFAFNTVPADRAHADVLSLGAADASSTSRGPAETATKAKKTQTSPAASHARLGSFSLLLVLFEEIVFLFDALFNACQLQRFNANHFVLRSTLFAGYHVRLLPLRRLQCSVVVAFRAAGHSSLLTFQTESYCGIASSRFGNHR